MVGSTTEDAKGMSLEDYGSKSQDLDRSYHKQTTTVTGGQNHTHRLAGDIQTAHHKDGPRQPFITFGLSACTIS